MGRNRHTWKPTSKAAGSSNLSLNNMASRPSAQDTAEPAGRLTNRHSLPDHACAIALLVADVLVLADSHSFLLLLIQAVVALTRSLIAALLLLFTAAAAAMAASILPATQKAAPPAPGGTARVAAGIA